MSANDERQLFQSHRHLDWTDIIERPWTCQGRAGAAGRRSRLSARSRTASPRDPSPAGPGALLDGQVRDLPRAQGRSPNRPRTRLAPLAVCLP
jgi:hypothetical protein